MPEPVRDFVAKGRALGLLLCRTFTTQARRQLDEPVVENRDVTR